MLKKILIGVFTVIIIGGLSLIGNNIIDVAVLKANVKEIKVQDINVNDTLTSIKKQVNALYWYTIQRKNIRVPHDKTLQKNKQGESFNTFTTE